MPPTNYRTQGEKYSPRAPSTQTSRPLVRQALDRRSHARPADRSGPSGDRSNPGFPGRSSLSSGRHNRNGASPGSPMSDVESTTTHDVSTTYPNTPDLMSPHSSNPTNANSPITPGAEMMWSTLSPNPNSVQRSSLTSVNSNLPSDSDPAGPACLAARKVTLHREVPPKLSWLKDNTSEMTDLAGAICETSFHIGLLLKEHESTLTYEQKARLETWRDNYTFFRDPDERHKVRAMPISVLRIILKDALQTFSDTYWDFNNPYGGYSQDPLGSLQ